MCVFTILKSLFHISAKWTICFYFQQSYIVACHSVSSSDSELLQEGAKKNWHRNS